MLSPNVIIPFDGDHADIPAGFSRYTALDDALPKGSASNIGSTGGSATHTHTLNHNHPIESHLHTVSFSTRIDGSTYSMGTSGGRVNHDHSHFGIGYTGLSDGDTCQNTNLSFDAASSYPPYYEVIFIQSDGYNLIPPSGMIWHQQASRDGLTYHSASEGKFLKGASTGGNAGGTGGAASHYHTQSHTHTANSHSHATGGAGYEVGEGEDGGSGPSLSPSNSDPTPSNQTHQFSTTNATQNVNTNSDNTDSTATQPLHRELVPFKASVNTLPQPGDIACIAGDVPIGWLECDGENGTPDMQGYYVKNNSTAGSTAGSNTHSHTFEHTHTGLGTHTHTVSSPSGYGGTSGGRNGSGKTGVTDHRHNVSNCQTKTANYDANTTTTSSSDNAEPPYVNVRFIMFEFSIGGGALMGLL